MRRSFFGLLLCSFAALASAQPQQIADPNFDTRVPRPFLVKDRPKLLFDEGHHNVHRADRTYRAFVELVTNDGARLAVNRTKFTAKSLASYRLLVIAGPLGAAIEDEKRAATAAFTKAEIEAVQRWVRRGGGLLLLTDHEPVASASAGLVSAFGARPEKTVVLDPGHRLENMYSANILATKDNGLLRRTPVTCDVQRVLVFGGQSLSFPPGSVVIGLGSTAHIEKGGAPAGDGQMAAFRYGRGRVVITGDMGMMSAQLMVEGDEKNPWGMNWPGIDNRQLLLNTVRWLAGHKPCR